MKDKKLTLNEDYDFSSFYRDWLYDNSLDLAQDLLHDFEIDWKDNYSNPEEDDPYYKDVWEYINATSISINTIKNLQDLANEIESNPEEWLGYNWVEDYDVEDKALNWLWNKLENFDDEVEAKTKETITKWLDDYKNDYKIPYYNFEINIKESRSVDPGNSPSRYLYITLYSPKEEYEEASWGDYLDVEAIRFSDGHENRIGADTRLTYQDYINYNSSFWKKFTSILIDELDNIADDYIQEFDLEEV